MFEMVEKKAAPLLLRTAARSPIVSRSEAAGSSLTTAEGETAWRGPAPLSKLGGAASVESPAPNILSPCLITTTTFISAPSGAPGTRKTVGVGEIVEIGASMPVTWTISGGRIHGRKPKAENAIYWLAPEVGGSSTITATPKAGGSCSVTFKVIPPSMIVYSKGKDRPYDPGRSGSGFIAGMSIRPLDVNFAAIELREGTCPTVASGYYTHLKVSGRTLNMNDVEHQPNPKWGPVDAENNGTGDKIGTHPPGLPGPFEKGVMTWTIPQFYRLFNGSGNGVFFCNSIHVQSMGGTTGTEISIKGAANRTRTP